MIRREEDSSGRGRIDLIENFSQGRLEKRLRDTKGTGKWDTLYYFKDNELVREERDTDGDGFFDLRIFYEKGRIVRQEADTNADRRVDVWVNFQNGERVEQLEDQSYQGKITGRYLFKDGQVVGQEQVANAEPPSVASPFAITILRANSGPLRPAIGFGPRQHEPSQRRDHCARRPWQDDADRCLAAAMWGGRGRIHDGHQHA